MLSLEHLVRADRSDDGHFGTEVNCWQTELYGAPYWAFSWAFDRYLVCEVKSLPLAEREWNVAEQCWLVSEDWAPRLAARLVGLGYPVYGFHEDL